LLSGRRTLACEGKRQPWTGTEATHEKIDRHIGAVGVAAYSLIARRIPAAWKQPAAVVIAALTAILGSRAGRSEAGTAGASPAEGRNDLRRVLENALHEEGRRAVSGIVRPRTGSF